MVDYSDDIVFGGGMNSDDGPRSVPKGDVRELWYCRLGDALGQSFCIVTSKGTEEVANAGVLPADKIIGVTANVERVSAIYMVWKATGIHEIWEYSILAQTHTLLSASTEWNFQVNQFILHFGIAGPILVFTDGYKLAGDMWLAGGRRFNPIYSINIERAINGDYTTTDYNTVNFVKFPHIYGPVCEYQTDVNRYDNKLRKQLYRFRAQYVYWDNEEAALSPYSNLALPEKTEFVSGTNWAEVREDNVIEVIVNSGPYTVRKINMAVSVNGGPFGFFLQLDKDELGWPDNAQRRFYYYGDTVEKPLPLAIRNYDRVPLVAKTLAMLPTKQVAAANYYEGYDKFALNVSVEPVFKELVWSPITGGTAIGAPFGLTINFVAIDGFKYAAGDTITVYLTFTIPSAAKVQLTYTITEEDINEAIYIASFGVIPAENIILFAIAEAYAEQINDFFGSNVATAYNILGSVYIDPTTAVSYAVSIFTVNTRGFKTTMSRPTLKSGAEHAFSLNYYDEANRDTSVITTPDLNLYVPFYSEDNAEDLRADFYNVNNPYTAHGRLKIFHVPPIDLNHFQVIARANTQISDFQQRVIVDITSDGDRWKISLEKWYKPNNIGASINHTPKKGDMGRPIRQRMPDATIPTISSYMATPFEFEVLDYSETLGANNGECIWTEKFNLNYLNAGGIYKAIQIELYTRNPVLNEDGTLFVASWKEIAQEYPILNPHTATRVHRGSFVELTAFATVSGTDDFRVYGNHEYIAGYEMTVTIQTPTPYTITGIILSATYTPSSNTTQLAITAGLFPDSNATGRMSGYLDQSTDYVRPALLEMTGWGDVYLKQRNYGTTYVANRFFYWYNEDPHYSDYWISNFNNFGRVAAEVPTAKQTHKKATAIHGGNYIDNTQINNLSTFELIFLKGETINVKEMDDSFGEVLKSIIDGKTLKCLQPRKENSIYIAAGGYSVTATGEEAPVYISNQTFTQWRPYESLHGASAAGEVALVPQQGIIYWDKLSATFIESISNGQINITDGEPYKFRTAANEIAQLYVIDPETYVRTYIDEENNEVGFAFYYRESVSPLVEKFRIVTFDYKRRRWASNYDYPFVNFVNLGRTLLGFDINNQLHIHNVEGSYTFHGEAAVEKIKFVTNNLPQFIKRFQDIGIRTNVFWNVEEATTEAGTSYGAQVTTLQKEEFSSKENFVEARFKRDRNSPNYATQALARVKGDVMRGTAMTITISRDVDGKSITFAIKINGVLSENIQ